jgi:hypothetical protein
MMTAAKMVNSTSNRRLVRLTSATACLDSVNLTLRHFAHRDGGVRSLMLLCLSSGNFLR